ncbi:MAG: hypothetical protein KIS86_06315 [Devosia sp.]|nr:hypothetical protein [Devosia sp.]
MDMKIDAQVRARELIDRLSHPTDRHRLNEAPTLCDIGYDSLSVVELVMSVEAEMEDRGVTTEIDDDRWSIATPVAEVEAEISTLLEGRDLI